MADSTSAVRQRKAKDVLETKIVPDDELPSEDENNLFAGTPAAKLRPALDNAPSTPNPAKKKSKSKRKADVDTEGYSLWLDALRVLTFLIVASCGLSYVMSSGESWTWGYKNKPWILRPQYWKLIWNGPINLTPEELLAFDGSDPEKPIYLAINHTIYDVSSNPRVYGPGGSYNVFAGHDASRGFVTGCFREDRTPDLRGVEEMYLPLDDPETDKFWTYEEMQALRAQELAEAREKVDGQFGHWANFFANSDQYMRVGRVILPEDWLEKTPRRALCEIAQKGRKRRLLPHEKEAEEKRKLEKKEEKRRKKEEKKRERAAEKKLEDEREKAERQKRGAY